MILLVTGSGGGGVWDRRVRAGYARGVARCGYAGATGRVAWLAALVGENDCMHVDLVVDLARQFVAGGLSGEDYLAQVEGERAVTLPAADGAPGPA